MPRRVIVEADGGSRGNPGPAAYGALVRDADSGTVLAQRAERIGVATNNVAEYRGLIAGLELARDHAPHADLEVRMDSKLVIEQMAGRWKIKHPDMRPLAMQARRLAPPGVVWTWVPRARNGAADALLNAALDAANGRSARRLREPVEPAQPDQPAAPAAWMAKPMLGWRDSGANPPTTIVLLCHGLTAQAKARLFSGSGDGDPGLDDDGRDQVQRAARWLARRGGVDAVVTSPLRRARETADVVAASLGLEVGLVEDLAEAAFGSWDGLSYAEVQQRWPEELAAWLEDSAAAPPGGESYDDVAARTRAALDELLAAHAGRTVLAVSHVTPIKMMVRFALDAPMDVVHHLQVAPGSLTTLSWWADGTPALEEFSVVPE